MTAPTNPLTTLHSLLAEHPLSQLETRRLQALINDVLVDAHENSSTDLAFEDFLQLLPASLVRVLVELLAPVADHPHAGVELDLTLHVLKALTTRLVG